MKLIGLFLTTLVAIGSCDTALEKFASGNLKFTARLYNEILKEQPNSNFIFSPFSVEVILALTRAGAKGATASEFTSALNLPDEETTEKALKQFLPTLKTSEDDLKLLSANKLYLGKNFKFLESFQKLATGTFDAGIENVDFGQKDQASNTINHWVEDQTNNRIKNLISPDSIDHATRLILVNALYFKGKWSTPFESWTRKEKFYLSKTESREVDMMHVEDSFRYYESPHLNAKFLELPYLGGNVSMTIVLPNEKEGLSSIESNIESVLTPQNLTWQRVSVKMPSFLVESELKLKPILEKLGLKTIFSDSADLSGISKEDLKVSDVIQKAFINVTTGGTEAAAATAGKVYKPCNFLPPNAVFIADHPFFYFIKYTENVTLLVGTVRKFKDYYDNFYNCAAN